MRTTLNIEDDLLLVVKDRARRERRSVGEVVSELLRRAIDAPAKISTAAAVAEPAAFYGFTPLPKRDVVVSDELVNRLRDEVE